MPSFENYCRCPGCGECEAHRDAREKAFVADLDMKYRAADLVDLYSKANAENDNVVDMLTQLAKEIREL